MKQPRALHSILLLLIAVLAMHPLTAAAQPKKLRVFILAGQSNMEGPVSIKTFDYIGDDPATVPMLKKMRGADGKPAVCEGAWISYLTSAGEKSFVLNGKLTAGYGSMWGQDPTTPGDKIGPEFTFGLTLDAALDEPVLIIKTAWGGKSLHTDFRPPSAGPYELKDESVDILAFRRAMAAPAAMPEFKGNVVAVQTAPFWSDELGTIADKHETVKQMRYFLDSKDKNHPNADGQMTDAQKNEYLKKCEADLTPEEREVVQKRVEMLHRAWTKDRNYLAPPDVGTRASLDPALILTPPRGMEAGYVPIATRQELGDAATQPGGR